MSELTSFALPSLSCQQKLECSARASFHPAPDLTGQQKRATLPRRSLRKTTHYRGFGDASPFVAGVLALGFCALGLFAFVGLVGFTGFAAGLFPRLLEFGLAAGALLPASVIRSFTRRLPA